MGIGSARGDDRAVEAAEMAISQPAARGLDRRRPRGAAVDLRRAPTSACSRSTRRRSWSSNAAHPDANIIFGAVIDDALGDEVRVTVIAAGFDEMQPTAPEPEVKRLPPPPPQQRTAPPPPRPATIQATVVSEAASPQPAPEPEPVAEAVAEPQPEAEPVEHPKVPQPAGNTEPSVAPHRLFTSEQTRRRPVVFDEDDDLDVPDFLK